jgi:hypothetical protein
LDDENDCMTGCEVTGLEAVEALAVEEAGFETGEVAAAGDDCAVAFLTNGLGGFFFLSMGNAAYR